ncbi:hypothetical protein [Mesorhizobium kowhaii]|uniref:hypothetical protein n=1 Tax=Mesorhizobium kowhaii TaxID=1300272 RepID=UPI0011B47365|nr:hypothetical protein [Mesorhizobium kowhaii]
MPGIGGSRTVQTPTGYTTEHIGWGPEAGYPPGTTFIGGGFSGYDALIPTFATSQVAVLGYLLAYDPFGEGYKLVRLEINDQVVFDAEHGIGASVNYRFYGGTQTAPDPITVGVMGDKAGAWQGFVMLFLDGYEADSAPSVKAVISNAATDTGASGAIEWTGEVPSGGIDAFPHGSAYDPSEDVIYQILEPTDIPGLSHIYLAVLDVDTLEERYRVPLEGSEPYAVGRDVVDYQLSVPIAMNGTGLVFVQFATLTMPNHMSAIYNAATGHLVASYIDTANMTWLTVQQFGHLWVFIGHNFDAGMGVTGIFDPAKGTFDVDPEGVASSYLIVNGRVTTGFTSFFTATSSFTGDADLYELRFDGDAWTSTLLHSLTGLTGLSADVLWFDPLTGYLVVGYDLTGPIYRWIYVDPETGTVIDTFDTAKMGTNVSFQLPRLHNRLISKPGFVLMLWSDGDPDEPVYEIISLDIQEKALSTFATDVVSPFTDDTRFSYLIADQGKGLWISALGEYVWTVHRQPNTVPGQVSLRWMLTKVMFLGGYSPEELTFEGFGPPDDGGDPDPDPIDPAVGAVWALDFLAGAYAHLGEAVAIADNIDKPDRVGDSGLEIPLEDVDGVVSAIGDFLADLVTMDWTVVIEWEELTTDGATYLLYLEALGDGHSLTIERSTAFANLRVDVNEGSFNTRYVEIDTSHGPGIHKIAVTRTNDFISVSCDGSSVDTLVVSPISMDAMATASFGGDPNVESFNNTFIRKVYLLAPVDDADLPGLSIVVP